MVPTYAKGGDPASRRIVGVVDAETGKPIPRVVEANTAEGWLVRIEVDENDRPIRRDGAFVHIREERAIRFVMKGDA